MGRRKSVVGGGTQEELLRKNSYYGQPEDRSPSRPTNPPNRAQSSKTLSRVPSARNVSSSPSKSADSFYRPPRAQEGGQGGGYMGFHGPAGGGGPPQQLQPLPMPHGGPPGVGALPYVMNGRGGGPLSNGGISSSGSQLSSAASAPLMRRASQIYRGPQPQGFGAPMQAPPLPRQASMRYPAAAGCPPPGMNDMHAQPLLSPRQQPPPPQHIDLQKMLLCFQRLPRMPPVMTPRGPMPPPPFPFPPPDMAFLQQRQQQLFQQQQQQMQQQQMPMTPRQGPPQQQQQQQQQMQQQMPMTPRQGPPQQQGYPQPQPYPQHPMQPAMSPQRSFYGPQGNAAAGGRPPNAGPHNGAVSPSAPLPGGVPPGGHPAPAAPPAASPLQRSASILNRVSSFKKPKTGAESTTAATSAAAASPAKAPEPPQGTGSILNRVSSFKKPKPGAKNTAAAAAAATSPAKAVEPSPGTGSILNRVSSFKKPGPDPAPAQGATKQKSHPAPVPPQHSATAAVAAAVAATSPRAGSTMRRQSFFAAAATAAPDAEPAAEEREKVLQEKMEQREQERQRLEAERVQREAAAEQLHQQRLQELRQMASSSAEAATSPVSRRSPTATGTAAAQRSPPSPQQRTSRSGSYDFNGVMPSAAAQPQRSSSPLPDINDMYYAAPTASAPPVQAAQTATAAAPQQLWHRSPTVVLYEVPLRCRHTTNDEGDDVIDDSGFPLRIYGRTLRVTDAATELVSEYRHDELVMHRKNSTSVESRLLDKVQEVVLAGYTASVLSLDTKGLAKTAAAFESPTWMAKQRLVMNVISRAATMEAVYAAQGHRGSGEGSSMEVLVSIALVKKASAARTAEWSITNPTTAQRTFEVVDLLQPQSAPVPLRMHTSALFGSRLGDVEYRPMVSEADFTAALAAAQNAAGAVLGPLADAAAEGPDSAALAAERDAVFEVLTCVVRHRKDGAVALADQLRQSPQSVLERGTAADFLSSDDEDDEGRLFDAFNSHNGPSADSDVVTSCLTCIGVRQNAELWAAALERKEEMAPPPLFNTAFGGPAYTVILASVDPTAAASADTLAMQAGMTIKLHRRPANGSAARLIKSAKYQAGVAQRELDRPQRPSGAEQRELRTSIRKSAAALVTLEKALAAGAQ